MSLRRELSNWFFQDKELENARESSLIRFKDDPLYEKELHEKRVEDFLSYLNSHFSRPDPNTFLTEGLAIAQAFFKDKSELDDVLIKKIIFDEKILAYFNMHKAGNELPSLLTENGQVLLQNVSEMMERYESVNGKTTLLFYGEMITPMLSWAVKDNLDRFQEVHDKTVSYADRRRLTKTLCVLGYLHGYFVEDEKCLQIIALSRKFDLGLPAVIEQYFDSLMQKNSNERLIALKAYWEEYFVQTFVASERAHDLSYKEVLSVSDRHKALMSIGSSSRGPADSHKQARRIDQQNLLRGRRSQVEQDFHLTTIGEQQQAAKTKKTLNEYTDELVRKYRPDHSTLFDTSGRPKDYWIPLEQAAPLVFSQFCEHADEISKSNLAPIANKLLGTLTEKSFPIKQAFGSDFLHLDPTEQVALIIFSCLSLQKPPHTDKRILQTIALISHSFQSTLQNFFYKGAEIQERSSGREQKSAPFSYTIFEKDAQNARERLEELQPSDGIISTNNHELAEQIIRSYEIINEISPEILKPFPHFKRTEYLAAFSLIIPIYFGSLDIQSILSAIALLSGVRFLNRKHMLEGISKSVSESVVFDNEFRSKLKIDYEKKQKEIQKKLYAILFSTLLLFPGLTAATIDITPKIVGAIRDHFTNDGTGESETDQINEKDVRPPNIWENNPFDSDKNDKLSGSPELASPQTLKELPNIHRATVFHFPQELQTSLESNSRIGLWPHGMTSSLPKDIYQELMELQQPIETHFVPHIDKDTHKADVDEFVVKILEPTNITQPIDGWKIKKIYQVGGNKPVIQWDGSLSYSGIMMATPPQELLLVLERDTFSHLPFGLKKSETLKAPRYSPWERWDEISLQFLDILPRIQNDQKLQYLYTQFYEALNNLVIRHKEGSLDEETLNALFSLSSLEHITKIRQYMSERTYSLLFKKNGLSPLEAIANQPEAGFYCAVANEAYAEITTSLGLVTFIRDSSKLRAYDNELFSRTYHRDTITILPNGDVFFTDMTPSIPQPGEDLSALEEVVPEGFEQQTLTKEQQEKILFILSSIFGIFAVNLIKGRFFDKKVRSQRAPRSSDEPEDNNEDEHSQREKQRVLEMLETIALFATTIETDPEATVFLAQHYSGSKEAFFIDFTANALYDIDNDVLTGIRQIKPEISLDSLSSEVRQKVLENIRFIASEVGRHDKKHSLSSRQSLLKKTLDDLLKNLS